MTIREKEQQFIDDFNELDDWFLQYEYLIEMICGVAELPEALRTGERRVAGCQSGVWLVMEHEDGRVRIRAHSDALIIRGILAVVVSLLDGRTPEEILNYEMHFVDATPLKEQMSTDRFRGMTAVIQEIKKFAEKQ